ncbi:Serine-threonine-protein kinase [Halomicronema hongdechloris C2206]|uniref:non-specific serine/threonine protein kinase n=1 Tax=Halomicronema hongdechloris C2206 TaxID=1641165 RepID=A0A1Z3HNI7_9CYAN|nr:serine/threonine-protein kinase [Halomicronema hongdechloris]ASC71852.1 Serine-threonine-protein kinase [Halomicronema hongdechloris C2206]
MTDFPDFTPYGYTLTDVLGCNRAGGRVTYLAQDCNHCTEVVIKQFQFAQTTAWSDLEAHEREIEVLRSLNHPGIPRYLDSFQTDNGFCMVQEYKQARPLSATRSFGPAEVRQLAIALLEILVYLQSRFPPVIHRDIKPDNILVDDHLRVYLVDFGFARIGDGEVGVSSVVKGTLGFMPPEQLFNRALTEASDLYGLGMTLVCLLTKTQPDAIGDLVDISYRVKFKHLLPTVNRPWINWLERLVEPRLKDRYSNAVTALEAVPNCAIYSPKVHLSTATIQLAATQSRQTLTHSLHIHNPIPETTLQGTWTIEPHPSDGPSDLQRHPWISVQPASFAGNRIDCQITVDVGRLMPDRLYERTLRLTSNALPEAYTLPLQVRTASVLAQKSQTYWQSLSLLFLFALFLYRGVYWFVGNPLAVDGNLALASFGTAAGTAAGFEIAGWTLATTGATISANASIIAGGGVGLITFLVAWSMAGAIGGSLTEILLGGGVGLASGWIAGIALGMTVEALINRYLSPGFAIRLALLTMALGCSLSLGLTIGLMRPEILALLTLLSLSLGTHLIQEPLRRARIIAHQQRTHRHLIRP